MLSKCLRNNTESVISGTCQKIEQTEDILKLLHVDYLLIISNEFKFIKECYSKNFNKPIILICQETHYKKLLDKQSKSSVKYREISYISFNDDLAQVNEKINIIFRNTEPNIAKNNVSILTKREREIVKLISQGKNNKEIANELFVSVRTIENHRANILRKTNSKNMLTLIKDLLNKGEL